MTTGILYIVATPIGNLEDISRRACDVLKTVAVIAAEDTRHSAVLLQQLGIGTPMISLHAYNEGARSVQLIERLQKGESVAVISDAGTPLVSDPGYELVKAAHTHQIKVVPIPGACALIAALSASGLPVSRFSFEGFLPAKNTARLQALTLVQNDPRTLIFYEAPHRLVESLTAMLQVFGEMRPATLARELTKTFETIKQASLQALLNFVEADPNQQKGEMVIVVQGAPETLSQKSTISAEALHILKILLSELPLKQAAQLTAKITGEAKNKLYEQGLKLKPPSTK